MVPHHKERKMESLDLRIELAKLSKELAVMKGKLEFATDNAAELAAQRDSAKQEVVELRAQVERMAKEINKYRGYMND